MVNLVLVAVLLRQFNVGQFPIFSEKYPRHDPDTFSVIYIGFMVSFRKCLSRHASELRLANLVILVLLAAWGVSKLDVKGHTEAFFTWIEARPVSGAVVFIVVDAALVVLLLPGIVLTVGAGFVFGVVTGTFYVVSATTLGAAMAYLIGSRFFGARARRLILSRPTLRTLHKSLAEKGWVFVLLTRMVPFFPFKLSNYFFDMSGFPFGSFIAGTFFGLIPITAFNAYLGSLAADITTVGAGARSRTGWEWALYLAGFLTTLVFLVVVTRIARRALRETETGG